MAQPIMATKSDSSQTIALYCYEKLYGYPYICLNHLNYVKSRSWEESRGTAFHLNAKGALLVK